MTSYIEEFRDAIINEEVVDNYPAMHTILLDHVMDSFHHTTREQGEELAQNIRTMYDAVKTPKLFDRIDNWNNRSFDLSTMTPEEKAYLKGKLEVLVDIVYHTVHSRPSQNQLDFGFDHLSDLAEIQNSLMLVYDDIKHSELYDQGLLTTIRHGYTPMCRLTPLGESIVEENKYKMWKALRS